jgi:hypothetical protein
MQPKNAISQVLWHAEIINTNKTKFTSKSTKSNYNAPKIPSLQCSFLTVFIMWQTMPLSLKISSNKNTILVMQSQHKISRLNKTLPQNGNYSGKFPSKQPFKQRIHAAVHN